MKDVFDFRFQDDERSLLEKEAEVKDSLNIDGIDEEHIMTWACALSGP